MQKTWVGKIGQKRLVEIKKLIQKSKDSLDFRRGVLSGLKKTRLFKDVSYDSIFRKLVREEEAGTAIGKLWVALPQGNRKELFNGWDDAKIESFKKDWPILPIAEIRAKYKKPDGAGYEKYQLSDIGRELGVSRKLRGSGSTRGAVAKGEDINKKREIISPEEFKKNISRYTDRVLKFLREFGPANADKISEEIDISAQMVFRVVEELARRGYQVVKDPDNRFRLSTSEAKVVTTEHHWRPTTKILIWSGAELGGIGQQADLLKTVYHTIIPEEKPDFVIALGNVIVGNLSVAKRNETFLALEQEYEEEYKKKKKISELLYRAQIDYVLNVIGDEAMTCSPSHRCNTYFISGLKEQSFIKQGLEDPLENICDQRRELKGAKRQDWFYFGRNMHMFRIINTGKPVGVLALTSKKNPFRGAYTRGYRPRKTSTSIAGWLINTLRTKGVNDYPRVILWTDGVGVYTALGDSEAATFVSLPKLAVTDPTELEMDTPPNLGCVIIDLTFDEHGELKTNGIECKFRNLAPYIKERGY